MLSGNIFSRVLDITSTEEEMRNSGLKDITDEKLCVELRDGPSKTFLLALLFLIRRLRKNTMKIQRIVGEEEWEKFQKQPEYFDFKFINDLILMRLERIVQSMLSTGDPSESQINVIVIDLLKENKKNGLKQKGGNYMALGE